MAKTTDAPVAMNNLNLFSNDDIPEDGEEGEDGWKGRGTIDDEEWDVIDLESIRKIAHAGPSFVCVGDDDDFVASIDELGGQLIDVTLNTSWLREEEVADHGNIVRQLGVLGEGIR